MLNNINIIGRLTKEPEIRHTQSGKTVASFSIACDRDRGDDTDFFEVVAWQGTAEFIEKYFHKGSMVVINGRLQQRTWEQDGKRRSTVEILAEHVYFGESKK